MTADELKAIEARAHRNTRIADVLGFKGDPWATESLALLAEVRRLAAENERLRALIKAVEWSGESVGCKTYACAWCNAAFAPDEDAMPHESGCLAFAEDGRVR